MIFTCCLTAIYQILHKDLCIILCTYRFNNYIKQALASQYNNVQTNLYDLDSFIFIIKENIDYLYYM